MLLWFWLCSLISNALYSLQWHHNERDGVSNHRRLDCLLNRLFGRRSKNTSKLRVTGLCEGNSPVTGEFPSQRVSNAENVSIWWRHHVITSWANCATVFRRMSFDPEIKFQYCRVQSTGNSNWYSDYTTPTYDKSILVQMIAWCYCLNQRQPRALTPHGVSMPQWVNWH